MFCGFCEQKTNGLCSVSVHRVEAYGQTTDLKERIYYCDSACVYASRRHNDESKIKKFIDASELLYGNVKKGQIGFLSETKDKESKLFAITMRSLMMFLTACLDRKPRKELEQLLDQAKRLFQEAFVYESYLNVLSKLNKVFLRDQLVDVWAK